MVARVLIRIYQPADPGRQVWGLLETKLTEGGIALGLLASGILAWSAGTATSLPSKVLLGSRTWEEFCLSLC